MADFVLVPGACHGGWCFDALSDSLRQIGVHAAGWEGESPFTPTHRRLREDPRWITHALDSKHNLMRDVPDQLPQILLDAAGSAA